MEFKEKGLTAKAFHEKKAERLKVLESSYKKYYNLLYNYGLKLTNDSTQVQDFIQEIFIKLCKRENIDDISDLKVYLLRAMRNTIYDYYAAQKDIVNIDDMEFSIPEDDEIFKIFFSKNDEELQKYKTLLQTINSLPNQQKQILYLFYIKDLSHKEIAEILDINPQSSMNSLSKSIHKLRMRFKQISPK
jgi:RNA polymerase sigma factor, sigma-70 family